jgi:hypothetical protein
MPQSIPAGITRDHVLRALADLDTGFNHPFGQPTGYELLHEGRRYAPKAVVGVAHRHLAGRVLQPEQFSGGEAPGQANFVLRRLGFTVVKKGEEVAAAAEQDQTGREWSENEVRVIVADYFEMLRAELHGHNYSKTEHRESISPQLPARSKGSIEFKHQNISAVLVELGLPYIDGYKPRGNYQGLLAGAVESYLEENPSILTELPKTPVVKPANAPKLVVSNLDLVIEPPPEHIVVPRSREKPWLTRRGRRIDFAEVDALNRHLAKLGEEFVLEVERHRLLALGRDDLAARVQWVSQTIGDGLGFDVLSFDDADDTERFLEVKTTGLGKYFPFYVTINEVNCSQDVPEKYHLYRVFDFARDPRLYILHGSLREMCRLDPIQFRATLALSPKAQLRAP